MRKKEEIPLGGGFFRPPFFFFLPLLLPRSLASPGMTASLQHLVLVLLLSSATLLLSTAAGK